MSSRLTLVDFFGRTASTVAVDHRVGRQSAHSRVRLLADQPEIGQSVNFNASASRPPAGRTLVTYTWDFGDGSPASDNGQTAIVSKTYATAGHLSP